MDEKIRFYIKSALNEYLETARSRALAGKSELLENVRWIEERVPISSKRDLALGYSVATLTAIGIRLTQTTRMRSGEDATTQDILDVRRIVAERLHEILDEIERELETQP